MYQKRTFIAAVVICWLAGAAVEAQPYSRLIIFGDSLSDTGNVHHATFGFSPLSPPHYQGRFSNGPVWAEHLAWGLGRETPVPSRRGGSNHAYGGARTGGGHVTYWPFQFPNIGTQINSYLSGQTPAADELFVIWGGGNDLMSTDNHPSVPASSMAGHVSDLAAAGAVNFLVPNLPSLGQIPRYRGTASQLIMNSRSLQFNSLLSSHLSSLADSLSLNLFQLDVAGLFQDLFADPGAYGLTNVTSPAYSGGSVAPDADEYLFWDDVHPSATGHALLGEAALALLFAPLPGDANRDGRVDGEDFLIWQAGFGVQSGASWDMGDFNGDGRVDGEDFLIWQAHFGAAAGTSSMTPEPAAPALVVAAAALLSLRRRRIYK